MDIRLSLPFLSGRRGPDAPVVGDERQQVVDLLHGKHYQDALRGRVFSHSPTPLGLAIPIYTGTALAGGMPIWNPLGSGVNVELISANIARTSGTADFGAIGLMARKISIAAIGTGLALTAFAETTPINGLLFGGQALAVKSSNAGTVTATAGAAADFIRTLATINLEADTGTAHAATVAEVDFDGTVIIPPGVLVYLACTKATTALFSSTLVWKEVPLD